MNKNNITCTIDFQKMRAYEIIQNEKAVKDVILSYYTKDDDALLIDAENMKELKVKYNSLLKSGELYELSTLIVTLNNEKISIYEAWLIKAILEE